MKTFYEFYQILSEYYQPFTLQKSHPAAKIIFEALGGVQFVKETGVHRLMDTGDGLQMMLGDFSKLSHCNIKAESMDKNGIPIPNSNRYPEPTYKILFYKANDWGGSLEGLNKKHIQAKDIKPALLEVAFSSDHRGWAGSLEKPEFQDHPTADWKQDWEKRFAAGKATI